MSHISGGLNTAAVVLSSVGLGLPLLVLVWLLILIGTVHLSTGVYAGEYVNQIFIKVAHCILNLS